MRPSFLFAGIAASTCLVGQSLASVTTSTACSASNSICVLQDDTGCPSGCSTYAGGPSSLSFTGGSSCSSGVNICTCDYWQGHTKVYFTASGVVSADGDGVLKQSTADPQRCAERCRGASGCFSAFFRYWTCLLYTSPSPRD